MTTYTKFSVAAKIRLHEKFTSEIFYWRKYPDLRYTPYLHVLVGTKLLIYNIWFVVYGVTIMVSRE